MSKPNAQTVALIRMAALTLASHGIGVSIYKPGSRVLVSPEQMLAVCKATKLTPAATPMEEVLACAVLLLDLDGLTYSTVCNMDELAKYGIKPTNIETEKGAPSWGPFAKDQTLLWFPSEDSNRPERVTVVETFQETMDPEDRVEVMRSGAIYPTSARASHLLTPEAWAAAKGGAPGA